MHIFYPAVYIYWPREKCQKAWTNVEAMLGDNPLVYFCWQPTHWPLPAALGGDGGPSQSAAETHHFSSLLPYYVHSTVLVGADSTGGIHQSLPSIVPISGGSVPLQRACIDSTVATPCTSIYRTRRAVQLRSHHSCRLPRISPIRDPIYMKSCKIMEKE